ncbi:hypothetical protein BP5796_05102 [Coleophoma crateriformis]|uniref:C2H2-type domain-containing protein n=1 Tax=Coleophoma crateriformis TaxID=565419 RepID=A0A3D8S2V2_9HELO|nr:hypothetical protein BP5796_05102 [Coleophoma crateriformis]
MDQSGVSGISPDECPASAADLEKSLPAAKGAREAGSQASIFVCTHAACNRSFNRRENLSRHMKAHDTTKAHACSICGKTFTRSDLLKRHVAGHARWSKKAGERSPAPTSLPAYAPIKRRKVAFDPTVEIDDQDEKSPQVGTHRQTGSAEASPGQDVTQSLDRHAQYGQTGLSNDFKGACTPNDQGTFHSPGMPGQDPNMQYSNPYPEHHQFTPQNGDLQLNHQNSDLSVAHTDFSSLMPLDFTSYLLPHDSAEVLDGSHEWFSTDFYSAMRETGFDWDNTGQPLDQTYMSSWQNDESPAVSQHDVESHYTGTPSQAYEKPPRKEAVPEPNSNTLVEDHGPISRISSPPNEVSEDDKWPFQWNPNSRPILNAKAIDISLDHPLFQNHNPKFDINQTTFLKLRAFLNPPAGREFHQSQQGKVMLPSLPIVNLFIGLFFERFSPQAPVLHHATINTNGDLPPPLLVAMIIIGATYSHQRHTRRFAIVLLDILRWHLQIALECDNSLMREPLIIYTEALVCHAALWCGNKRAFVMAEIVRGMVVTHIRRANLGSKERSIAKDTDGLSGKDALQAQWHQWITEEMQRRLYWVVYTMDAQFPSLLNLPATISIGEIIDLGCPCDEEFWLASSARNWKNLLGPALVPPSRAFSAAAGPFILSTSLSASLNCSVSKSIKREREQRLHDRLPILDLNPWSAFLVMMTIQNEVFKYSQESLLARKFMEEDDLMDDSSMTNEGDIDDGILVLKKQQTAHRNQLSRALSSWSKAYLSPSSRAISHPTSKHFHSASIVLCHLATILLDICLTDLQNAIGKDGSAGIPQAMTNLTKWTTENPQKAEEVAHNAVKIIVFLNSKRERYEEDAYLTDTVPYNLITIFLCHVVLWAYANVATPASKLHLLETVAANEVLHSSPFFATLANGLSEDQSSAVDRVQHTNGATKTPGSDFPRLLFKSAAEMLAQFATWGAALNLALLLHNRAEMQ